MARFPTNTSRNAIFRATPDTINGMEDFIRWCEYDCPQKLPVAMNKLVKTMALVNQGEARMLSVGPRDPKQRNPAWAWKIPVRRISNRYFLGWQVMRLGQASYLLYNASREAYYIEFGISQVGGPGFGSAQRYVPQRRIRRPIRKLSLRRTLYFMMRTHAYHRIWCDIFVDPRRRTRGKGFSQIVQSPGMDSGRTALTAAGTLPMMSRSQP